MSGNASENEGPDFTGRFRAIIARYARGEQTLEEAAKDFAQVWEESTHAPRAVRSPTVRAPSIGLNLRTEGGNLIDEQSDEDSAKLDALIEAAFAIMKKAR